MYRFTVLISCMHQRDKSILERSNVQSDVIVVNQCDYNNIEEFDFFNKFGQQKHCTFISTTERGLSRSRNMAIRHAADNSICLICDDDEVLEDDVEKKIINSYKLHEDAVCIIFALIRKDLKKEKTYLKVPGIPGFRQILKTSSQQISFNKNRITSLGIEFDPKMGSGTGNGGGEENKFLLDIRRKRGMIYYEPDVIATVLPGESQWFKGYTPLHMESLGWSSRRAMGFFTGYIYINYWVATHGKFYKNDISTFKAWYHIIKGFFQKR